MHLTNPQKGSRLLPLLLLFIWTATSATHAAESPPYFPSGSLSQDSPPSDEFVNSWYSKHLAAMGEPVIHPEHGLVVYRFTWLRTFHHPIAVRVSFDGRTASLHAVELSGAGGYDPGQISRVVDRQLSAAEFSRLSKLINQKGFWQLSSRRGEGGLDGSEWIIEGATDNRYHVISRWSPESGPVRVLGGYFLSLSGWRFKRSETY